MAARQHNAQVNKKGFQGSEFHYLVSNYFQGFLNPREILFRENNRGLERGFLQCVSMEGLGLIRIRPGRTSSRWVVKHPLLQSLIWKMGRKMVLGFPPIYEHLLKTSIRWTLIYDYHHEIFLWMPQVTSVTLWLLALVWVWWFADGMASGSLNWCLC